MVTVPFSTMIGVMRSAGKLQQCGHLIRSLGHIYLGICNSLATIMHLGLRRKRTVRVGIKNDFRLGFGGQNKLLSVAHVWRTGLASGYVIVRRRN